MFQNAPVRPEVRIRSVCIHPDRKKETLINHQEMSAPFPAKHNQVRRTPGLKNLQIAGQPLHCIPEGLIGGIRSGLIIGFLLRVECGRTDRGALIRILLVTEKEKKKKKKRGVRGGSRAQGETQTGNEGGTLTDKDECGKPPFISFH